MRFRKDTCYPHPPRGRGRKQYQMSNEARLARRRNLSKARLRSDRESRIIKLLVWQSSWDGGPRPSQRALARKLGVWPSYVHKVQRVAHTEGMDALVRHRRRVTLADLDEAQRFTAKLREQEPDVLAPAPRRLYGGEPRARMYTADEIISEQRRIAEEWKRKNLPRYDNRRRISVPIPR